MMFMLYRHLVIKPTVFIQLSPQQPGLILQSHRYRITPNNQPLIAEAYRYSRYRSLDCKLDE